MAFNLAPFKLSRAPARFAGPNHEIKLAAPLALVAEIDMTANRLGMGRAEFMRAAVAAVIAQAKAA